MKILDSSKYLSVTAYLAKARKYVQELNEIEESILNILEIENSEDNQELIDIVFDYIWNNRKTSDALFYQLNIQVGNE